MLLKVYPSYLAAVSAVNINFLFPIGIGLILGGFVFMKIIKLCFDRYHTQTYYAIIGFSIRFIVYIIA